MWSCFVERWGYHHRKKKAKLKDPPIMTPRQRLFSFLLAACSLFLTSSVHTATIAMQPRMVELWMYQVQHVRRFHSYKKQKQRSHGIISSYVWYFPTLLIGWIMTIGGITLLALLLNINYEMEKGLYHNVKSTMGIAKL